MRRAAHISRAPTPLRKPCGPRTTVCRCSAATASFASIRWRCGTGTRARSEWWKGLSRYELTPAPSPVRNGAPFNDRFRSNERSDSMIDLTPSDNDLRVLDAVREDALIARHYARYYDENEHEFPPDELPEAKDRPGYLSRLGERTENDAGMAVLTTLIAMGQTWGDYSVRMRRNERGLGNSALQAAGTPEQKRKWGDLVLAMAITEPGCGSDPSLVRTTATLDGDHWVLNGEKIFVTTGCRAEGVVVWATIDRAAGRAGIKSFLVLKGTPGFIVPHKE